MNAMATSKKEKAIIKANGNKPTIKYKKPKDMILNVNPLRIVSRRWPEKILAPKRKPKDTCLAQYEINSIRTSKGSKPKGVPAGTNSEKNFNPWFRKPNIVLPKTTVKLKAITNRKWLVVAKLYGLLDKSYRLTKSDYILTIKLFL